VHLSLHGVKIGNDVERVYNMSNLIKHAELEKSANSGTIMGNMCVVALVMGATTRLVLNRGLK